MYFIRILLVHEIYTAHVVALCRRSISTGHGTVSLSFLLSVHNIWVIGCDRQEVSQQHWSFILSCNSWNSLAKIRQHHIKFHDNVRKEMFRHKFRIGVGSSTEKRLLSSISSHTMMNWRSCLWTLHSQCSKVSLLVLQPHFRLVHY